MEKYKLYFETPDSEMLFELSSFEEGLVVYPAKRIKLNGEFQCMKYHSFHTSGEGDCGSECPGYKPRNGKSGCCVHHCSWSYEPDLDNPVTVKKEGV